MKTRLHSPAASGRRAQALFHLLARRAGLWAALGFAALAFVGLSARAADVTEAWVHRYSNVLSNANNTNQAQAVAVDVSGNVVVTGYSYNSSGNSDYYTAKYAVADGALLWEKRYNGPATGDDFAQAVAVDGSGNVVVAGYSQNGCFDNFYTAKYAAADGALLWEKRANGGGQALALDGSGNVVVTGRYSAGCEGSPLWYTAKYAAADGALLWDQSSNGGSDFATAVAVDGSGNVLVTGGSRNRIEASYDYYTEKYAAADGALLWKKRYNGPGHSSDFPTAVAVDGSGNVLVTGSSVGSEGNSDYYTAKYAAAEGALLWEQRYNGSTNSADRASALAVDASGNVLVTGSSVGSEGSFDYYTAKYAAAEGALLWEQRHNGPVTYDDQAQAVAVDGSGDVVVTGSSVGSEGNSDYYTAKYAAADGALLWEQRYTGPANGDDKVLTSRSLALGPNGIVAVVGSSVGNLGPGTTYDYATVVYRENLPPVILGARGVKENVLAELIALRATVPDQDDGKKLDEAIEHLTQSLAVELWVDQTHLERKHGEKVFHEEQETVKKLCDLSKKSNILDAVLEEFIDRLFRADRLLASVAIQDSITVDVSRKKIEQAQKFLAGGDAEAGDDKCANGIEDYRNAWKLAVHP